MASDDEMGAGQSLPEKARSLENLGVGPVVSSLSAISAASKALPFGKDFHFFRNFDEFKLPLRQVAEQSQFLLESVGSSSELWGKKPTPFPRNVDIDGDDALDWLVNVNDDIFERLDVSIDEFEKNRKKGEETGRVFGAEGAEDGFQMVYGKKKKKAASGDDLGSHSISGKEEPVSGVKVRKAAVGTGKAKVPFHIPTIKKPQEEYRILVNNSNQPFEHVWLERREDGQGLTHPLEKVSVMDLVDKDVKNIEPIESPTIESTAFKLVEDVKDLKELSAKLRKVDEFAVDLEHNQYRSFQGLTCLMQISTRTEDFIIDTLKLRIHVGPYLREVFKDRTKRKVMHGADRDIMWLQRDFGIYICNLFDTGQASRVLKLERNSLEHLLHLFCGVTANKEYQNADWRLRPLPDEMLRYAREDTHYLLYIYDLMRIKLFAMPNDSEHSDAPLVEVYKRSYDVCMQFYEKDILTENSYLHVYGLQGADLNAEQLAIVSGLYEWRDIVARTEDESTGYILPNKTLLEIAKQMPVTASKLRRLLRSKNSYIERHLGSVVSIIKQSLQNAAAFETVAQQLREGRTVPGGALDEDFVVNEADPSPADTLRDLKSADDGTENIDGCSAMSDGKSEQLPATPQVKEAALEYRDSVAEAGRREQSSLSEQQDINGSLSRAQESNAVVRCSGEPKASTSMLPSVKSGPGATVQVLKRPSSGFAALLGNAASKRSDTDKKGEEKAKLEQIRSSFGLPFHSFVDRDEVQEPVIKEPVKNLEVLEHEEHAVAASKSNLEDIILLEDSPNAEESQSITNISESANVAREENSGAHPLETNEEEPMSLSDLSTSFQKCFKPINQNKRADTAHKSKEPSGLVQIKPFDYEAARKQTRFGDGKDEQSGSGEHWKNPYGSKGKRISAIGQVQIEDGTKEFPEARRRQAFPATGNRSATFR